MLRKESRRAVRSYSCPLSVNSNSRRIGIDLALWPNVAQVEPDLPARVELKNRKVSYLISDQAGLSAPRLRIGMRGCLRKSAHREKSHPCLAASGILRVQVRGAHRENAHLATMSRRVTVLPQGNSPDKCSIFTKIGNGLARGSQNVGKASGAVVIAGLSVSASSVLFGPEALIPGAAMIETGGVLGLGAGGLQWAAGAFQYLGGADNHNMRNAAIGVGTGLVLSRAIAGPGVRGSPSASQRAAQGIAKSSAAHAGGTYDVMMSFLSDMAPVEASCKAN
jgi:hypothetical protein